MVVESTTEPAKRLWTELGYEFMEHANPERGLLVLMDMKRGIEIISPAGSAATELRAFLERRGEGV